jgi:hypothetical protein
MQVTRIIVTISEVANLGNYSSTKPSFTIEADVHPNDNVDEVVSELYGKVKASIEGHVDYALMADNQSPRFHSGPRADLYISNLLRLGALVPSKSGGRPEFYEAMYKYGPLMWDRIAQRWPVSAAAEKIRSNIEYDSDSLSVEGYPFQILEYPFNDQAIELINKRKAEWLSQYEAKKEAARLARDEASRQEREQQADPA